jgi:thiaminase (transcriptional activator TenA)
LRVNSLGSFNEGISSLYACFWIYQKVGTKLKEKLKENKIENKIKEYLEWIDEYSSEDFEKGTHEMRDIIEKETSNIEEKEYKLCLNHFIKTCEMEYRFWDSAYHLSNWDFSKKIKRIPKCVMTIAGSDSGGGAGNI